MEFSDPFPVAGPVSYSPDGALVAAVVDGMRVSIRQAETLQVVRVCECCDIVQQIEWSSDSKHVLCAQLLRGRVWIFAVPTEPKADLIQAPIAKIDEGVCGLSWARWAPDAAHVLTCSQFNIRLTIWDLADPHRHHYIDNPKSPEKALAFDRDGKLLAVAHRRNFKDFVHLYSTELWSEIASWEAGTMNLAGLAFAPNGAFLCVWDGPLHYNVCVYGVPKGEQLMACCAYEDALAVKTVHWSPKSMLLAVGSYDQRVRIVNYLTWKVVCELDHHAGAVTSPSTAVYIESRSGPDTSQYVLGQVPFAVPENSPDPDRDSAAKFGVGLMRWSADGAHLATRNDNQPGCVYVWEARTLSLACVLVHLGPVRTFAWSRTGPQLLIVAESSRLFTWTPDGAACVTIPAEGFRASGCVTSPGRDAFVIWDRSQAVAGFIDETWRQHDGA